MDYQQKGVRTLHPEYRAMADKWQKCRDCAAGEKSVHKAGELYLPKLEGESIQDYNKRLKRTPFFNATWRTIAGLRGMMFRKPEHIDSPEALKAYFTDIDMAGTPLQTYVQDLVEEALTVGRVGVLVDYPQAPTDEGVTVAQAEALGFRPSLQTYPTESIINWKADRIGNATVLSKVVLVEDTPIESDDEFAHDKERRYRVLDLGDNEGTLAYRQRVFRINPDTDKEEQVGEDVFPLMNGKPLQFIPFCIIGTDGVGLEIDEPPLIDLVDMNIHHYQVSADYEHGCHFSGLPTLFVSGYTPPTVNTPGQPTNIYIGGPNANCLPDPQAKAYFVETTNDFTALRTNLEDKKSQMAVLGARMLEQQKAKVETAETAAQHRKGEESLLAAMAQSLSLGVTSVLTWFAQWAGIDGEVKYEINRDFQPVRLDAQGLTALVGAWQAGAISDQTLFDNLQGGEVIEPDVTFEEEQSRITESGPKLSGMPPIKPEPASAPV